jgi:ribosomal protein S27AE
MPAKLSQQTFIDRAMQKHGGQYTYEKVEFVNVTTKVEITCPSHGSFMQTPKDHMHKYGCPKCGGTGKVTTQEFIARARQVHGSTYCYDSTTLISMNKKVAIKCYDHGTFLQRPADHLNGAGCMKCSMYVRGKYSDSYFTENPDEQNHHALLYLVTVDDRFCKIGITKQRVSQRFGTSKVKTIISVSTTLGEAYRLEQALLHKYKGQRYRTVGLTSRQFAGWTECFPLAMVEPFTKELETLNG